MKACCNCAAVGEAAFTEQTRVFRVPKAAPLPAAEPPVWAAADATQRTTAIKTHPANFIGAKNSTWCHPLIWSVLRTAWPPAWLKFVSVEDDGITVRTRSTIYAREADRRRSGRPPDALSPINLPRPGRIIKESHGFFMRRSHVIHPWIPYCGLEVGLTRTPRSTCVPASSGIPSGSSCCCVLPSYARMIRWTSE